MASDSVHFNPYGVVAERCSIVARGMTERRVDLRSAGSDGVDLDIDCNLPIKIGLAVERGAFRPEASAIPEHTAAYAASVGYRAGFTLPVAGAVWSVSDVSGSDLTGEGKTFVPAGLQKITAPFDAIMTFRLDWNTPTAELVAGAYRETITVTVTGDDTPLQLGF